MEPRGTVPAQFDHGKPFSFSTQVLSTRMDDLECDHSILSKRHLPRECSNDFSGAGTMTCITREWYGIP